MSQTIAPGRLEERADAVRNLFRDRHGRAPDVTAVAPGRVNLIGEHVDYNDGQCLPLALPHATYAAVSARSDERVVIASGQQDVPWTGELSHLGPGDVEGWAAYVAGVVWALREAGMAVPGLEITVDSTVPVGAGLSSSAALECATAVAVCELIDVQVTDAVRQELVRACMRAETEVAGAPTGGMDQTVALFARHGHALLLDCRDWTTEQVPWAPERDGLGLLVIDTRATHDLADGGYASRRADCEKAARSLGVSSLREVAEREPGDGSSTLAGITEERVRRRARHVLTEMARVRDAVPLLRTGDLAGFGRLMDASHESLRDDFEVSCAELDLAVRTARDHGALGARMTGGGFGGSAIALVPQDAMDAVSDAVAAAFAGESWAAPGFLVAEAAGGARLLPAD